MANNLSAQSETLTVGSLLKCITPPDNELYFVYVGDNTYLEATSIGNCIKVTNSTDLLDSSIYPTVTAGFFDSLEQSLTIMLDKAYMEPDGEKSVASCKETRTSLFTKIGEFPKVDCQILTNQLTLFTKRGLVLEADLMSRINEDVLVSEAAAALEREDFLAFEEAYERTTLPDSKTQLFFKAVDLLNLRCLNICLKNGIYVDIRDNNENTALSRMLRQRRANNNATLMQDNADNEKYMEIARRLIMDGASTRVALAKCAKGADDNDPFFDDLKDIEFACRELMGA